METLLPLPHNYNDKNFNIINNAKCGGLVRVATKQACWLDDQWAHLLGDSLSGQIR